MDADTPFREIEKPASALLSRTFPHRKKEAVKECGSVPGEDPLFAELRQQCMRQQLEGELDNEAAQEELIRLREREDD
jgi:hypothetical protein